RRSSSASASLAQRTSSGPRRSFAPSPSNTSTPRAPCAATQLASRSRSSSGEPNPPACSRLKPSKRYRVGSDISLPPRLVEEERRRDAHVERLDPAELRDRDLQVAGAPNVGAQALVLGSEDEGDTAGQVGLPHRRSRLAHSTRDPEIASLDVREVAGEVRHDGDREMLDRPGRGTANGSGDPRRSVRGDDDAA